MLRISYTNIDTLPDEPDGLQLSEYRQRRLAGLRPAEKRRQGIGAELLLIDAIRELTDDLSLPLEIEADEHGKPCIVGKGIYFNLSHSGSIAACVLSDRPVGLDVQEVSSVKENVLRRFFCADEQEYILRSEDRDFAFTEIWTKKESYIKAAGHGLAFPLNSFSVFKLSDRAQIWHTELDELHLSVCVLSGSAVPDELKFKKLP